MGKEQNKLYIIIDGIKFHAEHLKLKKKDFLSLFNNLKNEKELENIYEKAQSILMKEKEKKDVQLPEKEG
jgi:hypothetical protein